MFFYIFSFLAFLLPQFLMASSEDVMPRDPSFDEAATSPSSFPEISSYSINVMWINKVSKEYRASEEYRDSRIENFGNYLIPGEADAVLKQLSKVFEWTEKNPEANVNFWYDSTYINPEALDNTMGLMRSREEERARITFRDIRELSVVAENPDIFSYRLPIFFRIDLARATLLQHLVTSGEVECAIYADLDMLSKTKEELFDSDTVKKLHNYGMVFPMGPFGYENGFLMQTAFNSNMLKAIQYAVIDLNISRGKLALTQGGYPNISNRMPGNWNTPEIIRMSPLQQIVYNSYKDMMAVFYSLKFGFSLTGGSKKYTADELILDKTIYRYNNYPTFLTLDTSCHPETILADLGIMTEELHRFIFPTKSVPLPPTAYSWDD